VSFHELLDPFPRALQALAKRGRRDAAHVGGLVAGKPEDLAQHVGHSVLAIEAQQHPVVQPTITSSARRSSSTPRQS
jgi:hypothetical protein